MSRIQAALGSALFFLIAPFFLGGVIPWLMTHWRTQAADYPGAAAVHVIGIALSAAGVAVLIDSFTRFALQGRGTPAPVAPPSSLVVTGFYRHVRNPMYVGVIAAILGQAMAFSDVRLLSYAVILWIGFHVFVFLFEEPTLTSQFGPAYEAYRSAVPRWIPRLAPWRPA